MAEEKIQLTFGGEYKAGEMFAAAQKDVKDFQKAHKDLTSAARSSITQIAGAFDGELGGAIRQTTGILSQLATGGIWGAIGSVATLAITSVIQHVQEAHAEFEKYQQRLKDMRKGHEELLKAQVAAAEAAKQNNLDAIAQNANNAVAAVDRLTASMRSLAAAEDASIGAAGQLKIAQINDEFSKRLEEACDEMKPLVAAEKNLAIALQNQETVREQQNRAIEREKSALVDLEGKIELQKAALQAEINAGGDVAAAREKLANLMTRHNEQTLRLANAETAAQTALLRNETAVREATAAVDKAKQAWNKAIAANEEANAVTEAKSKKERHLAYIMGVCEKNQVEAAAYIEVFSKMMMAGASEAEAYKELQKKLNKELQDRIAAEKGATDATKGTGTGKGGKLSEAISTALKKSKLKVDVNAAGVGSGVDKAKAGKDWSETQKAARATQKEMNKDVYPMMRAMKGQMPKDERKLFEQYMTNKYTKQQVAEIGKEAIRRQLLNSREKKDELKYLRKMVAATEKQGLK